VLGLLLDVLATVGAGAIVADAVARDAACALVDAPVDAPVNALVGAPDDAHEARIATAKVTTAERMPVPTLRAPP
jgi:hypothetical protein